MYKSTWKLIFIQIFAPNGFLVYYPWASKLLCDVAFTLRPKELSCWLKKWLISGNLAIWTVHVLEKSDIWMFPSSSRDTFTLLKQNSVTDVSLGFRPPCWCPPGWALRLHTNLDKIFSAYCWNRLTSMRARDMKNTSLCFVTRGRVVVVVVVVKSKPDVSRNRVTTDLSL